MASLVAAAPVIFKVVSAVAAVASIASSVAGSRSQTDQAVRQEQARAGVSDYNAEIARQNAAQARAAATQDAGDLRAEARRKTSAIRARLAAGGVVTTAGSPLLAQAEQEREGAFAAERRLYRGELEARGAEQQSVLDTYRGDISRSNIGFEGAAGGIRETSAIIGGVSNLVTVGQSIL
jgi:hypothetical protein